MKRIFLIATGILILTVFWSCEDNRGQNLLPDKVYLVKTGLNIEESFDIGEKYVTQIWANKSGLNSTSGTIAFSIDPTVLEQYNAENGTNLELLPEDCYSIPQTTFYVQGDEQYAKLQIEYDPAKIVAAWENAHGDDPGFSKYGLIGYVLPVSVASNDVEVLESQNASLLQFTVNEPLIRILTDHFELVRVFEGETGNIEKTVEIGMAFSNRWDASITLETDRPALRTLVPGSKGKIKYSETRLKSKTEGDTEIFSKILTHIEGVLPPENAYTVSGDLLVKPGVDKLSVTVSIDKSKLHPGLNIVPVKLTTVTAPLKVDPNRDVCYIPVQYVPDRTQVPIKSSSSHQSADYSPKRIAGVFDGNFDISWRPGVNATSFPNGIGNDNSPAIVVDLGAVKDVGAVELWTRGPSERQGSRTETYRTSPSYIKNVKVYVSSDDRSWEGIGEFLLQGTTLITTAKAYWGSALVDYNWTANNQNSAPCTLALPEGTRGKYVIIWFTKDANQADIWELFVYGNRQ